MLEEIPCNNCRSPEIKIKYYVPSGRLVQCKRCGLVYVSPRKKENIISSSNDLWTASELQEIIIENEKGSMRNADKRLEIIEKFKPEKGELLEVGCYAGIFLKTAKEREWKVSGVEPIKKASEFTQSKYKVKVYNSTLNEMDVPKEHFDCICLFHVLEHLEDPFQAIEKIYDGLKEDGILVIEVPNFQNIWRKLLRSHWRQFISNHFFFYTPHSLDSLVNKASQGRFSKSFVKNVGKWIEVGFFLSRLKRYTPVLAKYCKWVAEKASLQKKVIILNFGDVFLSIYRKLE